ncbi:MAG: hypothetical protein ACHREM_02745 [Polyangiales bacterium]
MPIAPRPLGLVAVALWGVSGVACQAGPPQYLPSAEYDSPAEPGKLYRWTFDPPPVAGTGVVSSRPSRTFLPTYGKWEIVQDATAPSPPNVYVPLSRAWSAREISPSAAQVEVVGIALTDFTARVRVKVSRPTALRYANFTGLAITTSDSGRGIVAAISPNFGDGMQRFTLLSVSRDEGKVTQVLPSRERPIPAGDASWSAITIEVRGGNLTARLDDDLVLDIADMVHGPARVGLLNLSTDPVAFDDLEVREIPQGERDTPSKR